ncbi:unnamed protein product [Ambrosiozyma monospora]|uniref:Unnamed protein product n=1 Tax=Ambrosiozyma monospora TaxID=43982 RepID=A0ACB5U8X1_AMBMO|nr:unnamed protein product [Ambrosiozyma monospora]
MATKWDTSCGCSKTYSTSVASTLSTNFYQFGIVTTSAWDTSCGCSKTHTFSTAWSYSTSYSTAYTFKAKRDVSTDSEGAANMPTVKAAAGVMAIAGSLLALL